MYHNVRCLERSQQCICCSSLLKTAAQHSTVQHSTVQCRAVQCSVLQHSAVLTCISSVEGHQSSGVQPLQSTTDPLPGQTCWAVCEEGREGKLIGEIVGEERRGEKRREVSRM
jgi:hypothetical protein